MTDKRTFVIGTDEADWEHSEIREGRQPAVVVSVRLDPSEAARLRARANAAGLTVSQVIRKALAEDEAKNDQARVRKLFVSAFTYGGTMPIVDEQGWRWYGSTQVRLFDIGETFGGGGSPTATEPTRVQERVTVEG